MSRPFTVTTEQVREWLSATEKRKAAILIHEAGGPLPEGREYINGMEVADAKAWAKYDLREKLTMALMNLRPRSFYRIGKVSYDKCTWMESVIPAMVDELIAEFQDVEEGLMDELAVTGKVPEGLVL